MKKSAFTMAEILISLTIIGIIAAITLPALQSNINEKTWATQKKALFSRMTQAISMMPSMNGYGLGSTESETNNNATQTFIAELGKTLRINNVCDNEHLRDCGINISTADSSIFIVNNIKGTSVGIPTGGLSVLYQYNSVHRDDEHNYNVKVGGFETANGENILVYYNPYCVGNNFYPDSANFIFNKICANFVYDLNGTKGPNTIGKDVGVITAFYSSDSAVAMPVPLANYDKGNFNDASSTCRQLDEDSRLPNLEEAMAIRLNFTLFTNDVASDSWIAWTNKIHNSETAWAYGKDGEYFNYSKDFSDGFVWCVKR